MVCDHIEIAEKGRKCEVCHLLNEMDNEICASCSSVLANLQIQGTRVYGSSLIHVLTSLQRWAKDLPARELIRGMELLTEPVNQRFLRPNQQRLAPFIVGALLKEGSSRANSSVNLDSPCCFLCIGGNLPHGLWIC